VSLEKTLLLGFIAGVTILLWLPIGRLRSASVGLRATLNAVAIGILLFLLWDVLSHAVEPIEQALPGAGGSDPSWSRFAGLAAVLALGLGVGLLSLVYYDEWMARRVAARTGAPERHGPGAMSVAERPVAKVFNLADPARRLALLIAVGIGLHNFSEGLAIGQSAASGELSLAVLLIIGFGLHNATEGFGIVGPLGGVRPSWRWLLAAGLVGGGPTFVGTLVGYQVHSDPLELCFYALAGGAILYVVGEIWTAVRRYGYRTLGLYFLAFGFLIGVATDLIVTYGGA